MLSTRRLHKWLFSLTLILSLSTAVNASSFEIISKNNIELVIDSDLSDIIHFYDVAKTQSFKISNIIFNAQLVTIYSCSIDQKIRAQHNTQLNQITNYQLSFLQLLTKKNVLTDLG